jgi:hypothetical protein
MSKVVEMFGDGDDGGESSKNTIYIDIIDNGYILTIENDDESVKRAYLSKKDLISELMEFL